MEDSCEVVELKEIDGSTLMQLISFLYGHTIDVRNDTVSLFVAADAHQVGTMVACTNTYMHTIVSLSVGGNAPVDLSATLDFWDHSYKCFGECTAC